MAIGSNIPCCAQESHALVNNIQRQSPTPGGRMYGDCRRCFLEELSFIVTLKPTIAYTLLLSMRMRVTIHFRSYVGEQAKV